MKTYDNSTSWKTVLRIIIVGSIIGCFGLWTTKMPFWYGVAIGIIAGMIVCAIIRHFDDDLNRNLAIACSLVAFATVPVCLTSMFAVSKPDFITIVAKLAFLYGILVSALVFYIVEFMRIVVPFWLKNFGLSE